MTTIKELVRAAVAYRDAPGTNRTIEFPGLLAAADTLDTSGEVVLSREDVVALIVHADERTTYPMDKLVARDRILAAIKEQS